MLAGLGAVAAGRLGAEPIARLVRARPRLTLGLLALTATLLSTG